MVEEREKADQFVTIVACLAILRGPKVTADKAFELTATGGAVGIP